MLDKSIVADSFNLEGAALDISFLGRRCRKGGSEGDQERQNKMVGLHDSDCVGRVVSKELPHRVVVEIK